MPSAHLHLFCGKIASGKSTLAATLARGPRAVLISEDEWLKTLFGDQMHGIPDYVRVSEKLRAAMEPHVASLLEVEANVVLDFPANTPDTRKWMRRIIDKTGAAHTLHVLDIPDDVCFARMKTRLENGDHPFTLTEAQFQKINGHIQPPRDDEGFTVLRHGG